MEENFLNYSDIFYKKKQRDCKISFEMNKTKNGKEKVYKHTPTLNEIVKNVETDYEEIIVTDLWKEKRKGKKDSIIGTSIVNILNAGNTLNKLFREYKLKIKEIQPKMLEELYNQFIDIKKKYGLDKMNKESVLELYYKIDDKINEKSENYMFKENKIVSNKEIIKQIKPVEDKEYKLVYNFLKEVYSFDIEEKIGLSGQCSLIISVLSNTANKNIDISLIFFSTVQNYLEMLMKDIEKLIGENAIFINNSIYNFITDFQNIYLFRESELYKVEKYNILYKYQFEQPNNTFYNKMRIYLENKPDENSNNFIYDIIITFLDSLISDIEHIKFMANMRYMPNIDIINIFKDFYSSSSELPRVQVEYIKITKDFYGNTLKTPKSVPYMYSYYITTLLELYDVTIYHLYLDNREIHRCKNCGRYFITDTKNSEIFCKRIDFKYKGRKTRYCFEIGQQENRSQDISKAKNLHHTLYNRFRNHYRKTEFPRYMKEYEEIKNKLRNGKITKKQYEKFFERYDRNFKKKHPSDRYNRKSKNKHL